MKKIIYMVLVIGIIACTKREEIKPSFVTSDSVRVIKDTTNWYFILYVDSTLKYEAYSNYQSDNDPNLKVQVNVDVTKGVANESVTACAYLLDSSKVWTYMLQPSYKLLDLGQMPDPNDTYQHERRKVKGIATKNNITIIFKNTF